MIAALTILWATVGVAALAWLIWTATRNRTGATDGGRGGRRAAEPSPAGLADDEWIYGSDPANIFATITEGRPNGMPPFRGRLPNYQVWELVAYVRALGGLQGKAIRTTRDDHMMYKESEQARNKGHPTPTFVPPSSVQP